MDAVKRYQGKQNTTIKDSVIDTMNREMRLHNLTISNVEKVDLYMFLS